MKIQSHSAPAPRLASPRSPAHADSRQSAEWLGLDRVDPRVSGTLAVSGLTTAGALFDLRALSIHLPAILPAAIATVLSPLTGLGGMGFLGFSVYRAAKNDIFNPKQDLFQSACGVAKVGGLLTEASGAAASLLLGSQTQSASPLLSGLAAHSHDLMCYGGLAFYGGYGANELYKGFREDNLRSKVAGAVMLAAAGTALVAPFAALGIYMGAHIYKLSGPPKVASEPVKASV